MLASAVTTYRLRAGLTQEDLARRTGLAVRSIRDVECGRVRRPRPLTVTVLADAFGLHGAERERFVVGGLGALPLPDPGRGDDAQPGADALVVPAQLPLAPADFVGRRIELDRLDRSLLTDDDVPGRSLVFVVCGMAGVGKTSLAVHWAQARAHHFPGGQLFIDLSAAPPGPEAVRAALERVLPALGAHVHAPPADVDAWAAAYRTALAGRSTLVVVDGARCAQQIRPLLPGSPTCRVLVTSRNAMSGLVAREGADSLELETLTRADAYELVVRRLARGGTVDEAVLRRIVEACARLPLALCAAAASARARTRLPLSVTLSGLDDPDAVLDILATYDSSSDLRAVFTLAYRELSPVAARLFEAIGVLGTTEVTVDQAASVLACGRPAARQALCELRREHLVSELTSGTFTMHPLLRVYAAEVALTRRERHLRTIAGRLAGVPGAPPPPGL